MGRPGYLGDFIVRTERVRPETVDGLDLYLPTDGGQAPLAMLVHGMLQQRPDVTPRGWPVYRGYASALARRGIAAAMIDRDLVEGFRYPEAIQTVLSALETARANESVDGERLAVWAFSAGGPLLLPIMAEAPPWLRCLAGTYPLLAQGHIPDWAPVDAALAS